MEDLETQDCARAPLLDQEQSETIEGGSPTTLRASFSDSPRPSSSCELSQLKAEYIPHEFITDSDLDAPRRPWYRVFWRRIAAAIEKDSNNPWRLRTYLYASLMIIGLLLIFIIFDLGGVKESLLAPAWEFDAQRDADNHGLSDEQCTAAFPDLYADIDKTVAKFQNNHITLENLKNNSHAWGRVRGLVHEGRLYIYDHTGGFNERKFATMASLHRSLAGFADAHTLPTIQFEIHTHDSAPVGTHAWSFTRKLAQTEESNIWLMPDFGFYTWPDPWVNGYTDLRSRIAGIEAEYPSFQDKEASLLWRGALNVNFGLRVGLMKATKDKPWADVDQVIWRHESMKNSYVTMQDHCRRQWNAYTEGVSFSGSLKYLLNCNSVTVSHEQAWATHFSHLLVNEGEYQNFVETRRDWADLEDKILALEKDPAEGARIAANAAAVFRDRYLTPAAVSCYWRRLIKGWASVSFTPEIYEDDPVLGRKVIGVDYESYIVQSAFTWPKPGETKKERRSLREYR